MKFKKHILILPLLALVACSPRVDDVFDDTSVVRLEQNREATMTRLKEAPNGWVMQYFAQSDQAASDSIKHRGYTFLMKFRNDGTVTVAGLVDGRYKTETSLWDVISDNSTVLTFNSFNSIFHYYSNPDPALGLWGADGEGVGGDYEFTVLEYDEDEQYQLLKGKKRGCYIRMYPLAEGQDWEEYYGLIDKMNERLFTDDAPLELFANGNRFTLYNGASHEFRAFKLGADTLGGGEYYGFIVTPNGIRFCDKEVMEQQVDAASMELNKAGDRLVSVENENVYVTMDALTAFQSYINNERVWAIDTLSYPASLIQGLETMDYNLKNGVGSARGNAKAAITGLAFEGSADQRVGLKISFTSNGKNSLSNTYYYTTTYTEQSCILEYDSTFSQGTLRNYEVENLVVLFNGEYIVEMETGFNPSLGTWMRKRDDNDFALRLYRE